MRKYWEIFIFVGFTLLCSACKTEETPLESSPIGDPYEVPVWNYATNHFFIDTIYYSIYNQYIQNPSVIAHPEYEIKWIHVWKPRMDIYHFADEVPVNAFISLPPLSSCTYESLRTTSYSEPGTIEVGMFIPLDHNLYSYDKFAGTLSIYDSTIKYSDLSIAVSYKLANGSQYGETPSMVWHDSIDITRPMILKLIRPRNLNSAQTVGWKLLMKNIYFIGKTEIAHTGFSLDIFRDNPNTGQSNSILGVFLLEVLGLDRFSGDEYLPDREFDFIPGITIDQSHGEIIFPNVRPFDNGIQEYFNSIGLSLPSNSEYLLPDLYDTTKVANMNSEEPLYYIRGRAVN